MTPAFPFGHDYRCEIVEVTLRNGQTRRLCRQTGSPVRSVPVTAELNGRYVEMVKGAKRARKKYINRSLA